MTEPRSTEGNYRISFIPQWFLPAWIVGGPATIGLGYLLVHLFHLPTTLVILPACLFAIAGIPKLAIVDKKATVSVDARGVSIDGRVRVEPPLRGRQIDQQGAVSLLIEGDGGKVTIFELPASAIAQWLDAANPTKTFRFMSRRFGMHARAVVWALFGGSAFAIVSNAVKGQSAMRILAPAIACIVTLVAQWFMRREQTDVEVGPTGITIDRRGERRVVPIEDVTSCALTLDGELAEGFVVRRRDGTEEAVAFPSVQESRYTKREEPARGVCDAITRALEERGKSSPAAPSTVH